MIERNQGYHARDCDVKNALSLQSRLANIRDGMLERKDCPIWFVADINWAIQMADLLIRPLTEHRDELK